MDSVEQIQQQSVPTENSPQAEISHDERSSNLLKKVIIIVLGLVVVGGIATGSWILYKTRVLNKNKTNQTTNLKPIFQQIQTRSNVDTIKNVNQNGQYGSGFMNPSVFTKKPLSDSSIIPQANAQEKNEDPFFFYTVKQKVLAYDIATGTQYTVFSITDIPNVSIQDGTAIDQVYFLNSSKRFVFFLQQALDSNHTKFKSSIDIYDPVTRQVNEIASATSGRGSIASWSQPAISPDENYLFAFYNNQEQQDPFADVVTPPGVDPYAQTTYFMYNLKTNSLSKFKLTYRLYGSGTVKSSWDQNSSSVLLGYASPLGSSPTVFLQIYLNGQVNMLTNNTSGLNHYLQVAYNNSSGSVYYIGSASTDDNASVFGSFDPTTKIFSTITPTNFHSLNFVYDFTKGYIFDTYQQTWTSSHTGGITNRVLSYYDIQSKTIKQLSNQSLAFVNFDGDYSHLLVATTYGVDPHGAKLYDLNVNSGTLTYLNTAPIVFSVYGSGITPIDTTAVPLPTSSPAPVFIKPTVVVPNTVDHTVAVPTVAQRIPTAVPTHVSSVTPASVSISSASPNYLPANYGTTQVTVSGSGFQNGARISIEGPSDLGSGQHLSGFGDYQATRVTYVSSQQIQGTIPAGLPAGYFRIVVTNPDGERSSTGLSLLHQGGS